MAPARLFPLDSALDRRGHRFPTKDEVADYLEAYAARFQLPVLTGVRVDRLLRGESGLGGGGGRPGFEAGNVVVAMATHKGPWVPPFADELDPGIVQLHSTEYRNPLSSSREVS